MHEFDHLDTNKKLREFGYSDRDLTLYHRLGPKVRAVIYNALRKISIINAIEQFQSQRVRLDPLDIDGRFYPQPLATVYGAGEGDDEFAVWLVRNKALPTYQGRRVDLEEAKKVEVMNSWDRRNIDI